MKEEEIEESSVRLVGRTGSEVDSRWVDGSEVDSESPPWSLQEDEQIREGYGSVRRGLVKKPKRVDSFDVEAMEIAGAHDHHDKSLEGHHHILLKYFAKDWCGLQNREHLWEVVL